MTKKVDHPTNSSKDVSDGVAGALFKASTSDFRLTPRELAVRAQTNMYGTEQEQLADTSREIAKKVFDAKDTNIFSDIDEWLSGE